MKTHGQKNAVNTSKKTMLKMKNNLTIYKDNQLIQSASSGLSLAEQRIILLCLAKWDSRDKIPNNREFIVSVDDFYTNLEISRSSAYQDLSTVVNTLYEQSIFLDPNNPETKMRWITAKVHRKEKSEISLFFSPEVIPMISGLKACFTGYKLKDVAKFKSSYSFRFYELLMSWKDKSEITVEVKWIREVLQLGNKYPVIADFKKRVVLPALADINRASNLNVTYDELKKGNVITQFVFKYKPKDSENKPKKITKAYILKNAKPGETWEQASARLNKNNEVSHD